MKYSNAYITVCLYLPAMAAEDLVTLGDLYCQDVAEGSVLVPGFPVSSVKTYRDGEPVSEFFQNRNKYHMYDGFKV